MRSLSISLLASLAAHSVHGQFAFYEVLNATYISHEQVQADPSIVPPAQENSQDTASELIKMTVPNTTFRLVDDHYVGTNGIAHFYFKQTANDIDVENADFNVNIGRDGEVFSFGHSFREGEVPAAVQSERLIKAEDALKTVAQAHQLSISTDGTIAEGKRDKTFALKRTTGTVAGPEARLVYYRAARDSLALAWRVETKTNDKWLITYVDAEGSGEIYHVVDYNAAATYEVYPWGISNPAEGSRVIVEDPWDEEASEFGWHSDGTATYNTTRGNNAIAHSNWDKADSEAEFLNLPRPVSENLTFVYPYDPAEEDWKSYVNASITQAFYTVNKYHDLFYLLGFTESAGNFQFNNNGKGGKDGDGVYINVQDGRGTNNANFATPPDGEAGILTLYMSVVTTPQRDFAFSIGTVLHELTHGLSKRLTGGPANSACMDPWEPGAMGEGISDWYAMTLSLKANDTREQSYPIFGWDSDDLDVGVRPYVLSTNMDVNPLVYEDANTLPIMHYVGTVWTTMLWDLLWDLIDAHGKNDADVPEFDDEGVPTDGKYLALKLVTDSMALQPCNPSFVQARDTIIDADWALTGGENRCLIWKAFARRGMGTEAVLYDWKNRTGSVEVPKDC